MFSLFPLVELVFTKESLYKWALNIILQTPKLRMEPYTLTRVPNIWYTPNPGDLVSKKTLVIYYWVYPMVCYRHITTVALFVATVILFLALVVPVLVFMWRWQPWSLWCDNGPASLRDEGHFRWSTMEEGILDIWISRKFGQIDRNFLSTTTDWYTTIATFTAVAIELTVLYFHRRLDR
jgi:hypothetical protein